MPEQARHFVIATWLSVMAPPQIDIHTAALQHYPVVSSSAGTEQDDNGTN